MPRGGPSGRGRGSMKTQQHKAQNGIGKKALGDIELLHTDTLIKEVSPKFLKTMRMNVDNCCYRSEYQLI